MDTINKRYINFESGDKMGGWMNKAAKQTHETVNSYEYKCDARRKPEYFSRNSGKIGFTNMIMITLNLLTKSMQTELDKFFELVQESDVRVRKQSYFDARHKLTKEAFKILFDNTAELALRGPDVSELSTYKGFRVLAVDGTTLSLENTCSLRGYFGVAGSGGGCAAARASVMVDVLNKGLILDACVDKLSCGERKLAVRHHERLMELGAEKSVMVFDRGYASADMFDMLTESGTAFLFRLKRRFSAEIDRMKPGDKVLDITIKKRTYRLRVLKFMLSTGEMETLITNISYETITTEELKELYNLRWGVETAYRTLKSALQLENFSGNCQLFVEQDFYAAMYLKNMLAFARLDADAIVTKNENPENMYRQQTNENQLIGCLKDKLVLALLEPRPRARVRKVNSILRDAVRHTVPIRPDRHFKRFRKNSKRFNSSGKCSL